MTRHVMIDLETLGQNPGCAVIAIGAVAFDIMKPVPPDGIEPQDTYGVNISVASCTDVGLTVNPETVEWWKRQSREARNALKNPPPIDIGKALDEFDAWVCENGQLKPTEVYAWSHATFDTPILQYAYHALDRKPPWHYRNARDLRTIQDMAYGYGPSGENVPVPKLGHHHEAVWDAIRMSLIARKCFERFNYERVPPEEGTIKLGEPLPF